MWRLRLATVMFRTVMLCATTFSYDTLSNSVVGTRLGIWWTTLRSENSSINIFSPLIKMRLMLEPHFLFKTPSTKSYITVFPALIFVLCRCQDIFFWALGRKLRRICRPERSGWKIEHLSSSYPFYPGIWSWWRYFSACSNLSRFFPTHFLMFHHLPSESNVVHSKIFQKVPERSNIFHQKPTLHVTGFSIIFHQ